MTQAIRRTGGTKLVRGKKYYYKGKGKEAARAVIAVLKNVPKK